MKFCEITVITNTFASELVADILWDYTSYGVAISDLNDVLEMQRDKNVYWDYIDERLISPSNEALVKCFVPLKEGAQTAAELEERFRLLKERTVDDTGSLELLRREVDGDAWLEVWKKHFRPIEIGSVTVCPQWIKPGQKDGQTVVLIGSNTAFGTGEHQTTSMCIRLLQEYVKSGDSIADIGCGSGILAITALLLGAKYAYMTDIDGVAVAAAAQNAAINNVSGSCLIQKTSDKTTQAPFNAVLANITAEVLINISGELNAYLKSGGVMILSGIIDSRLQSVTEIFSGMGYTVDKQLSADGWNALALKKAAV